MDTSANNQNPMQLSSANPFSTTVPAQAPVSPAPVVSETVDAITPAQEVNSVPNDPVSTPAPVQPATTINPVPNATVSPTQPTPSVPPTQPPPDPVVPPAPMQNPVADVPMETKKPKNNKPLIILLAVFLILSLSAGIIIYLLSQTPVPVDTQNNQPVVSEPVSAPISSTDTTEELPADQPYKNANGTFSFNYPSDWKVYDTETNPDVFTALNLDFKKAVLLEKDDNLMLILIQKYALGSEVGGIFMTADDKTAFTSKRSELTIMGDTFYLNNSSTSLSTLTDQNNEAGVFAYASLSEFVPKYANGYDGFSDIVQNKTGYTYSFFKLTKASEDQTSEVNQNELVATLKTIKW